MIGHETNAQNTQQDEGDLDMDAVMNFLDTLVGNVNTFLWDNLLMYLLVLTGIYFTFRLRFVQVRKFKAGLKALFGNFSLNGGSDGAGL